uniref:Cadherin domain-containing protein n=1 Tax=Steinernema glaseri TaxID=37863 RepID=A0A1I8AIB7_9BILA
MYRRLLPSLQGLRSQLCSESQLTSATLTATTEVEIGRLEMHQGEQGNQIFDITLVYDKEAFDVGNVSAVTDP